MPLISFLLFFLIAIVFASILFYGLKQSAGWGGFWGLLFILFLVAWAARLWILPAGPVFWGFAWIPIGFVVFLFVLLIAAAPKKDSHRTPPDDPEHDQTAKGLKGAAAIFSIFFWILVVALILAIIIGYIR
jgi:hypothetical protein